MSQISAKLCSISFSKQKFQTGISKENWNLIKWIVSCAAMMTVCVPYVYIVPHIAVNPSNNHSLNHTIYDTFENDLRINCQTDGQFCGLVWVKVVFFCAFAASQFSMGFLADRYGNWRVMKHTVKYLIVFGILTTLSSNIYLFYGCFFMMAFMSTACYLLLVAPILEATDEITQSWKWRLIIGVFFQMTWVFGRLISNFFVYLSESWISVIMGLVVSLLLIYFIFEDKIWDVNHIKKIKDDPDNQPSFIQELKKNNSLLLNFVVLSWTFFTLGYNTYGIMNSWRLISSHEKVYEHLIMASVLALIGKIGALFICFISRRKCLPLMVLQFCTAICYFVLSSVEFGQSHYLGFGMEYLVHVSSFFITASFSLLWSIVPETFPKKYRTTSTGICSGAARIGAITGIMIGELNLLHSSLIVNTLAAIVTLLSAVLIKILPDMTKERMPVTLEDITKVQFPEMFRNNSTNNVEIAESRF